VNSPIFDRRRAERLNELLDEAAGRRRRHRRTDLDPELSELVGLTRHLATLPAAPDPDAEFRSGLRAMLMAKVEREGIGVTAQAKASQLASRAAIAAKTQPVRQVPAGHGRTRAAVLIGVTAGALALSGVSAASTNSLPGQPLYQVKRSSERAQLAMAGSDLTRGQLHLEFAQSRVREAAMVPAQQALSVLADMNSETSRGLNLILGWAEQNRDTTALTGVDDFVESQRRLLYELRYSHQAEISDSLLVLQKYSDKTSQLRGSIHN